MAASPCAGCHARCCFAYVVPVTGYDVWRIATQMQLGPEQFAVAMTARKEQPTAFHLENAERAYTLVLDKQEGEPDDDERACTFWLPIGDGYGRCSVYAARPNVCRTYPAYLRDGAVHLRHDVLCPPRSWNLAGMSLTPWRVELMRGELEQATYVEVVRAWNEHVEWTDQIYSLAAFYAYLMRVYDALGPLHDEVDAAVLVDPEARGRLVEASRDATGAALGRVGALSAA
jgi:Fe-S-cluster containining protein